MMMASMRMMLEEWRLEVSKIKNINKMNKIIKINKTNKIYKTTKINTFSDADDSIDDLLVTTSEDEGVDDGGSNHDEGV